MLEGKNIDDGDLKIEVGLALLQTIDVKVVELFLGHVDQFIGLALVQALLDIIFEGLKANFFGFFVFFLFFVFAHDGVSCAPEHTVAVEILLVQHGQCFLQIFVGVGQLQEGYGALLAELEL
jgi:hypothetical protein